MSNAASRTEAIQKIYCVEVFKQAKVIITTTVVEPTYRLHLKLNTIINQLTFMHFHVIALQ